MVNIYCGYTGPVGTQLLVEPLVRVLKDVDSSAKTLSGAGFDMYKRCPAYVKYYKNTFAVKAVTDMSLTYTVGEGGAHLAENTKPPEWYNQNIVAEVSAGEYQLVQLNWEWYLFSEEDIEVSQIPAAIHVNQFLTSTVGTAGTMNISKWFRPIRPAFFMRKNSVVTINKGDVLFYIKVMTTEPVEIVPFDVSNKALDLSSEGVSIKLHKEPVSLSKLYNYFTKANYPAKVLAEIKKNLR